MTHPATASRRSLLRNSATTQPQKPLPTACWTDDVLGITVGEITGVAGKANVKYRPDSLDENNVGEDGDYWDDDMEEKYDVKIHPIADTSAAQAELAALREKLAAADKDFYSLDRQWSHRYRSEKRLAAEEMAGFRAAVAAALAELRTELVADANAMATHGSGTSACTIQDAFDATIAKLDLAEKEQPR